MTSIKEWFGSSIRPISWHFLQCGVIGMSPAENEAFTNFLLQKVAEYEALGYRPTAFKKMLSSQGGEETVRQLLSKDRLTEGFSRLWELNRLDLSVEALIVESPWRPFFDNALLLKAEKLLKQSNYDFKPLTTLNSSSTLSLTKESLELAPSHQQASYPPKLPKQQPNTMSFSAFCASLGAPLANRADRWCSYSAKRRLGIFNIWADRLKGSRYLLWDDATLSTDKRIGAKELGRILTEIMAAGHVAYGILSEAKDIDASTRTRGRFDEQQLLLLRLEKEGANIVAHVQGIVPAASVANNRPEAARPFDSAIDDLDAPPAGQNVPERISHRGGTGYRRDMAVRRYVIQRSKGACEHCGKLGFELPDGSFYVEAHHIIALSEQGPDTVSNVIALCPDHHRQAHYGKNAEALEQAFIKKLQSLGKY